MKRAIKGFVCRICKQHITEWDQQFYEEYDIIRPDHSERIVTIKIGSICRSCISQAKGQIEKSGVSDFQENLFG